MEVIVAKSAGFCFGVRRAVNEVYKLIEEGHKEKIYTYGPIIHNEEVIKDLHDKGVEIINDINSVNNIEKGIIVIRSHGISRKEEEIMRQSGHTIVDMTCQNVKKIHKLAEENSKEGRKVIIAGNPEHPEVKGIKGWCVDEAVILEDEKAADDFQPESGKEYLLVAQTTFHYTKFKNMVDLFLKKRYNIECVNTICNATRNRQEEAARLASESDAMLVIGGSASSNTQKLYEICKKECNNTHYIHTVADLDDQWFEKTDRLGVTGGASTPNIIIEEVLNHVRRIRTIIK